MVDMKRTRGLEDIYDTFMQWSHYEDLCKRRNPEESMKAKQEEVSGDLQSRGHSQNGRNGAQIEKVSSAPWKIQTL